MEYYIFADIGYDGGMINQYDTLEKAEKEYDDMLKETGLNNTYQGICLIKGEVLKNDGITELK